MTRIGCARGHHRKPRSLGGDDSDRNMSHPPPDKHRAWHTLFDNLPAKDVLNLFQAYLGLFSGSEDEWPGSQRFWVKKKCAWEKLFWGLSLHEIVRQINTVWLDPDYQFVVVPRQVDVVIIKKVFNC